MLVLIESIHCIYSRMWHIKSHRISEMWTMCASLWSSCFPFSPWHEYRLCDVFLSLFLSIRMWFCLNQINEIHTYSIFELSSCLRNQYNSYLHWLSYVTYFMGIGFLFENDMNAWVERMWFLFHVIAHKYELKVHCNDDKGAPATAISFSAQIQNFLPCVRSMQTILKLLLKFLSSARLARDLFIYEPENFAFFCTTFQQNK